MQKSEPLRVRLLYASINTAVTATLIFSQAAEAVLTIVVTGGKPSESAFDQPLSIDHLSEDEIHDAQAQVNLSESLIRVPGVVAQNRQNYAQDLQISSRGFGARSTFGIRGVRLIADGIPATMPDGQGQAATFDLDAAQRIEVLRGPFAVMYGNAAGGVIQLFSADPPSAPQFVAGQWFGSYDSRRTRLGLGTHVGDLGVSLDASRFHTDGYREHSAATRDQYYTKLRWQMSPNATLTFIGGGLRQPDTQDPLGLTRAQMEDDPRQVDPVARTFDTRKSIVHSQGGVVYEHRYDNDNTLFATIYAGTRDIRQYLSFPGSPPTSSGGVVDLDREFGGLNLRWRHGGVLMDRSYTFTVGMDRDTMDERRRGYENLNGTAGALRRDEDNRVANLDPYLQFEWDFIPQWKLHAGVRHSEVRFTSEDHYIVGINPDDSGKVSYRDTLPVIGVGYFPRPGIQLYANIARGFETPTFSELAYRPDGTPGPNFDLRPSRSQHAELGIKTDFKNEVRINVAVFDIDTEDEIVAGPTVNGRATFVNAGQTRRRGIETSLDATLGSHVSVNVAYTWLDARFTNASNASGSLDGLAMPGIPAHNLYTELSWRHAASGFRTALETQSRSKIFTTDNHADAAESYTVANWRASFSQQGEHWQISEFVRVDNLADRRYVGSVIVNDGNGRYFEPAPGRNYVVGMQGKYRY